MRRTASEVLRDLQVRVARLERQGFNPLFQKLHDLLKEGRFGEATVKNVDLRKNSKGQTELEWSLHVRDYRELLPQYDDSEHYAVDRAFRKFLSKSLDREMTANFFIENEYDAELDLSLKPNDPARAQTFRVDIDINEYFVRFTLIEAPSKL